MALSSAFRRVLNGSSVSAPSAVQWGFSSLRYNSTLTTPKLFVSGTFPTQILQSYIACGCPRFFSSGILKIGDFFDQEISVVSLPDGYTKNGIEEILDFGDSRNLEIREIHSYIFFFLCVWDTLCVILFPFLSGLFLAFGGRTCQRMKLLKSPDLLCSINVHNSQF